MRAVIKYVCLPIICVFNYCNADVFIYNDSYTYQQQTINCTSGEYCDIICNGYETCRGTTIHGPVGADLNVTCIGSFACSNVNIYASSSRNLYGVFEANMDKMSYRPGNANYAGKIYCPENWCQLVFDSKQQSAAITIHGEIAKQLIITAKGVIGQYVLSGNHIHCPRNQTSDESQASCVINAISDHPEPVPLYPPALVQESYIYVDHPSNVKFQADGFMNSTYNPFFFQDNYWVNASNIQVSWSQKQENPLIFNLTDPSDFSTNYMRSDKLNYTTIVQAPMIPLHEQCYFMEDCDQFVNLFMIKDRTNHSEWIDSCNTKKTLTLCNDLNFCDKQQTYFNYMQIHDSIWNLDDYNSIFYSVTKSPCQCPMECDIMNDCNVFANVFVNQSDPDYRNMVEICKYNKEQAECNADLFCERQQKYLNEQCGFDNVSSNHYAAQWNSITKSQYVACHPGKQTNGYGFVWIIVLVLLLLFYLMFFRI